MASRLTTITGRVPPCSFPSIGSSLARKPSPRRGVGIKAIERLLTFLLDFPITVAKFALDAFRIDAISLIGLHSCERCVYFHLPNSFQIDSQGRHQQIIKAVVHLLSGSSSLPIQGLGNARRCLNYPRF